MTGLTHKQQRAFEAACQVIDRARACEILHLKNWEHGMCGCLNAIKPEGPPLHDPSRSTNRHKVFSTGRPTWGSAQNASRFTVDDMRKLRFSGESDAAFRARTERAAQIARMLVDACLQNVCIQDFIDDPAPPKEIKVDDVEEMKPEENLLSEVELPGPPVIKAEPKKREIAEETAIEKFGDNIDGAAIV